MDGATLRFGEYEVDLARRELRCTGKPVALQKTPLKVLLHLAEHRDRTVPREELLDAVWHGVFVNEETLTRALTEVRRAVGDQGDAQRVIRTHKGVGYRFVAQVEMPASEPAAEAARISATSSFGAKATLALAAALVLGLVAWRSVETATASKAATVSFGLAVLPIDSVSSQREDRELARGLTEQLTHQLTQDGYPVVARTTVGRWARRAADVRGLRAGLGVSHLLQGSVRRVGGRVRVMMQLVSTESGLQIWSQEFEAAKSELGALQDRVASQVAYQTRLYVWPSDAALKRNPELARLADKIVEARRLAISGPGSWEDSLLVSEQLLHMAPEREPFLLLRAETLAQMSSTWGSLYDQGARPLRVAGPKVLATAERAVREAPESAVTHAALAGANLLLWRWAPAEREVQRACQLQPGSEDCELARVAACGVLGCIDQQLASARRSAERVPSDPFVQGVVLPAAYINNRRLLEAEGALLRMRQVFGPQWAWLLMRVQWQLGKHSEALDTWQQLAHALGDDEFAQGVALRRAQGSEAALRWIAEQQSAGRLAVRNWNNFSAADQYALLGDFDAALVELERAVAEHESPHFILDPIFDSIRDTPRFRKLIETMGLTPYHEKYGVLERARQHLAQSGE